MPDSSHSRLERTLSTDPVWREDPELHSRLTASEDLDDVRETVLEYFDDQEARLRDGVVDLDRIDLALALSMVATFKNLLSKESEALAGTSTLDTLIACARGDDEEISPGFVADITHMLRAARGIAPIGHGWFCDTDERIGGEAPLPRTGRRAGRMRSEYLDRLAAAMEAKVAAFPTGLEPSMVEKRAMNRRRILDLLGGSEEDWLDPSWQMANVFRGPEGVRRLQRVARLRGEDLASIHLAAQHRIPWGITPYYAALFDLECADRREDGQVRAQVIPSIHTVRAMVEHRADRGKSFDFMKESDTSPFPGITRRYPRIAIYKVCDTCPQICTYCQRNWEISDAMCMDNTPDHESLRKAMDWFADHPAISDVLLTGGDPLVLDDDRLAFLIGRLSEMPHVRNIRIGTRVPVTLPMRITDRLADTLAAAIIPGQRTVSVSTHVESSYEITPELAEAVFRLRRRGISVYNQQVFTLETSRRFQTVATRIALKQAGIDPYYLFYPKGKDEHRDALVPIARIVQERKEEARLLPGVFRTDESVFNVPRLGKNHLRASQDRELIAVRPDGRRVYLFHPWEKGIAPVAPWVYSDVSIHDYLQRMAARGEDIAEYESIWYYV